MIVHHDVNNEARDSQLLYPMAVATKGVLKVDHIQVVTDGGYSDAEEVARCEQDAIEKTRPS